MKMNFISMKKIKDFTTHWFTISEMEFNFTSIKEYEKASQQVYNSTYFLKTEKIPKLEKKIYEIEQLRENLVSKGSTNGFLITQYTRQLARLAKDIQEAEATIHSNKKKRETISKAKAMVKKQQQEQTPAYGASTPAPVTTPYTAAGGGVAIPGSNGDTEHIFNPFGSEAIGLSANEIRAKAMYSHKKQTLERNARDYREYTERQEANYRAYTERQEVGCRAYTERQEVGCRAYTEKREVASEDFAVMLRSPEFLQGLQDQDARLCKMNTPLQFPAPVGATPQQRDPAVANLFGAGSTGAQKRPDEYVSPVSMNLSPSPTKKTITNDVQQQQQQEENDRLLSLSPSPTKKTTTNGVQQQQEEQENILPQSTPPGDVATKLSSPAADKKMPAKDLTRATVEGSLALLKLDFDLALSLGIDCSRVKDGEIDYVMDAAINHLILLKEEQESENLFLKTFDDLGVGIGNWSEPYIESGEGKETATSIRDCLSPFIEDFKTNIIPCENYESQMELARDAVTKLEEQLDGLDLQKVRLPQDQIHCRFFRKAVIRITNHFVK